MPASVAETIQKLIKHSDSAREIGNLQEAEAFASKVQQLLTKHKLTMDEVSFAAQDVVDPFGHEVVAGAGRGAPAWSQILASAIAESLFCHAITEIGKNRIFFIGRNSDRALAVQMYRYLHSLAMSLKELEAEKQINETWIRSSIQRVAPNMMYSTEALEMVIAEERVKFKKGFLFGFAAAIGRRLESNCASLNHEASTQAQGLMLRDQAALVQYKAKTFRMTEAPTETKIDKGSNLGLAAGYAAGHAAQLAQRTALGSGN